MWLCGYVAGWLCSYVAIWLCGLKSFKISKSQSCEMSKNQTNEISKPHLFKFIRLLNTTHNIKNKANSKHPKSRYTQIPIFSRCDILPFTGNPPTSPERRACRSPLTKPPSNKTKKPNLPASLANPASPAAQQSIEIPQNL